MNELLDLVYSLGAGVMLGVLMRQIDEVRWHAGIALASGSGGLKRC
jgi:hypothetical protein